MPRFDDLLDQAITNLYVRKWTSDYCDNIDVIYELSNNLLFRFPDFWESLAEFPQPHLDETYSLCSKENPSHKSNLFDNAITDILIPHDPELRVPDCWVAKLSSGYFLFQESGVPIGTVPRIDIALNLDRESDAMVSIFNDTETPDGG